MIKKKANKKLARQAAEKLIRESKILLEAPIMLNDIIQHLRTRFDIDVHGKDMSDKFSGILVTKDNTFGILYNSSMSKNRIRFTIAHELGHLMLCHQFGKEIVYEKYNLNKQIDWWELEANTFAANLLMPQKLLQKDTKNLKKGDIPLLSKKYLVSEAAMTNRIYFSNQLLGVSSDPYYGNSIDEDNDI